MSGNVNEHENSGDIFNDAADVGRVSGLAEQFLRGSSRGDKKPEGPVSGENHKESQPAEGFDFGKGKSWDDDEVLEEVGSNQQDDEPVEEEEDVDPIHLERSETPNPVHTTATAASERSWENAQLAKPYSTETPSGKQGSVTPQPPVDRDQSGGLPAKSIQSKGQNLINLETGSIHDRLLMGTSLHKQYESLHAAHEATRNLVSHYEGMLTDFKKSHAQLIQENNVLRGELNDLKRRQNEIDSTCLEIFDAAAKIVQGKEKPEEIPDTMEEVRTRTEVAVEKAKSEKPLAMIVPQVKRKQKAPKFAW